MNPLIYQFLHVFSIIMLTGFTLYVAANPQKHTKRKMMIVTGVFALLALVAGSALVTKLYSSFPGKGWLQGWVIVKIVAWLLLSGMAGMAYRKSKSFVVSGVILLVAVALYMVYLRPF